MTEKQTVKNGFGVSIVVCCASCMFKEFKSEKERLCTLIRKPTHPSEYCNSWRMDPHLENAGKGDGRIRKKEWLEYVAEHGRTSQSIRDFEQKHGSIFLKGK